MTAALDRQRKREARERAERAVRADHAPRTLQGESRLCHADERQLTADIRGAERENAQIAQRRIAEQMLRDVDEFRRLGVDHDLSVTVRSVERQVKVMIRKLDEASR